jgi:hypothetical protein
MKKKVKITEKKDGFLIQTRFLWFFYNKGTFIKYRKFDEDVVNEVLNASKDQIIESKHNHLFRK